MSPWNLAIGNLSHITPDLRPKCKICGCRFEPQARQTIAKLCSDKCREEYNKIAKRERIHKRKALEECTPRHRQKREREAYWAQVFNMTR